MFADQSIPLVLALAVAGAVLSLLLPRPRQVLTTIVVVSAMEMMLAINIWTAVLGGRGFVTAAEQWFYIDAFSAFQISLYPNRLSLEAMWKYLIICSIGIAFAFMGTLLAAASIQSGGTVQADALFWTHLASADAHLDPILMKFAFVFVLVGYGTKAGLAPIHSWLPDAHSQAPAPVSAMFSGFLLNTALYCIMRFVTPVQHALGEGFTNGLLTAFGLLSILVAAGFIVFQRDAKRLLAYHSVEHMGIIALGYGLGPLGGFVALFL